MSDLLSRMITRPVSRVEPILSSRFEPATALEAPEPVEVHPPPTPGATEPAKRKEEVAKAESPVDRPQAPAPVEEGERMARREEQSASPPPVPSAADSAIPERPKADPPVARATEPVPIVEIQPQRIETHAIERTEIRSEVVRTRETVAAPARAYDRPRRRAEPAEGPRPEPVEVHVTIGHIEVRAAAPPAPPVRRASPPRVSLEDYLKRRNGGGR